MRPTSTLFSIFLFLLSANASADRWIVKNAKVMPPSVQVISNFQLGQDTYTVVNANESSIRLMGLTQSDSAFPDAKIGLVTSVTASVGAEGWQLDRMKYSQIPNDKNGNGIIVAVIDTGVDYTHPNLLNHMWKNMKEIPNNKIDDDGNGYVDDYDGYDFAGKTINPMDTYGHGTHCSGIIAADPNAAGTARGVAPGVKIMPLRIIGDANTGFLSDAANAVKYAVDNGAQVMSNSWRVYKSWSNYFDEKNAELLRAAIQYAADKNVIFVNAAGNETNDLDNLTDPMFPTSFEGLPNLFLVAATESGDIMANYSNFGLHHVHVAAPGSDILSTVPGNKWEVMSGTSMATPMVAGVIALGLQRGFTPNDAMAKLITTSDPTPGFNTKVISGGIINIQNYLQ